MGRKGTSDVGKILQFVTPLPPNPFPRFDNGFNRLRGTCLPFAQSVTRLRAVLCHICATLFGRLIGLVLLRIGQIWLQEELANWLLPARSAPSFRSQ